MNLTLKSIQYHARLSEETNCYSAKLFMDGKHVADVSNRGQGGCDEQHWIDRDAEAKISAHFASLPEKEVTFGESSFMVKPDLESWCGEELDVWLILQQVSRIARKKVALAKGSEISTLDLDPKHLDTKSKSGQTWREVIAEKYPGQEILNGLQGIDLRGKLIGLGVVAAPVI